MKASSPGAYSINFVFERLFLSEGAQLYIYNPDGSIVYGPVSADHNPSGGFFLSDLISGDEAIIQIIEPFTVKKGSSLKISKIVHGYVNMFPEQSKAPGSILNCHNDVNCYPAYKNESDGVALVLLANGTHHCSGCLLNNTKQDYRPFFLTAFHCIDSNHNGVLSNDEINAAQNWQFRFQYKAYCSGGSSSTTGYYSHNRATVKASWYNTDFLLMELNNFTLQSGNSQITYLGWDRSGSNPTSGTGIHHPAGNPMKISFENNSISTHTSTLSLRTPVNIITFPANNFWNVKFDDGTFEGGSSGSPLLNQNKRVVGQLAGGITSCPPSSEAFYGQLHRSWTGGLTDATRLSNWLSPNSTAATTNTIRVPTMTGPNTICSNNNTPFVIQSNSGNVTASSIVWTCSENLQPQEGNTGSSKVFRPKNAYQQTGWVKATIGGTSIKKDVIVNFPPPSSIPVITIGRNQAYTVTPPNEHPDITGYSWSWGATYSSLTLLAYNNYAVVSFTQPGVYTLFAKAKNACGTSPNPTYIYNFNVVNYSTKVSAYPNPASNTLSVEISEEFEQALTSEFNIADTKFTRVEPTYDIRLFDIQGNMVRQLSSKSKKVEINVSNLNNGFYYLHVVDNDDNKADVKTIIIRN